MKLYTCYGHACLRRIVAANKTEARLKFAKAMKHTLGAMFVPRPIDVVEEPIPKTKRKD